MTQKPFFSIIIPVLNEEKYLPLILNDLNHQSFKQFEVIIVDAQSKDNTIKKAQKFQSKLPSLVIISSSKKNVGYQRNLGVKNTKGKYLLFVDADTRISSYFLEGIKYRISITKPDIFTTWIAQDGTKKADRTIVTLLNTLQETSKLLKIPMAMGAMMGIKKNTFEKLGEFNTKVSYAEDAELLKRFVKNKYNFKLFKDPRYVYSLRRFRKEGTMPLIRKYAKLNLATLLNGYEATKDYPMLGGSYYSNKKITPPLILRLEKKIKTMRKSLKKQKIRMLLESLFAE